MNSNGEIMTVLGPISADQMGTTLPHEHALVDFAGAEKQGKNKYKIDQVVEMVVPHLEAVKGFGLRTMVECTPSYIGRDPLLLKRLSETVGMHFITNTGYYGSRNGFFLPTHAFTESADQLADRWTHEWEGGIGTTGIKPGFIKTAVNQPAPLSVIDRKLILAAARTHARTGLSIVCHTKDGPILEILELLMREGVDPSAFIWVHASGDLDMRRHVAAAALGAWVEFDWISENAEKDLPFLLNMKRAGYLGNVLLSHDAGWYDPGKPKGGPSAFKKYTPLFEYFIPALKVNGFSDVDIELLTVKNPASAFTIRQRLISTPV